MIISPEPTAEECRKQEIKVSTSTPEIEEIEDSENQNHDPYKEFLDQCKDCGISLTCK